MSRRSPLAATLLASVCRYDDDIADGCHERHFLTPVDGAASPVAAAAAAAGVHNRCTQTLSAAAAGFPALWRHLEVFCDDSESEPGASRRRAFLAPRKLRENVDGRARALTNQWRELTALLDSPAARCSLATPDWANLRDFSLCCVARGDDDSGACWSALRLSTAGRRARAVLSGLSASTADVGRRLLEACAADATLTDDLLKVVSRRLHEVKVYTKVMSSAMLKKFHSR